MKFYIATSLQNVEAHRELHQTLKARGHILTYDWTVHGSVRETSHERLRVVAERELWGVSEADFVVGLLPGRRGTHFELGFACGTRTPVYLIGPDNLFRVGPDTCAFYHLPEMQVVRDVESLLAALDSA